MLNHRKIAVVLPAYNAAKTLRRTIEEIPREIVDDVILTDDASRDNTVDLARELGLTTIRHAENRGYGANQKTCYRTALDRGADIVVMLHPDYEYKPKLIIAMASMIAFDQYDFVFDNQMLVQAIYFGFRVGEISCPTKYFEEASSINFSRSVRYGLGVLDT